MKVSANYTKTTSWNTKELAAGSKIEGEYIKKETFDGNYGAVTKYVIKSNGEFFGIFGSASLDRQFANIPEGAYVWVEFKGVETTKAGRTVKVYVVEYDPDYQA